MKFERALSV